MINFGGASILLYRNVCSLNLTNAPYLCDNLYNNSVWGTRYVCTKRRFAHRSHKKAFEQHAAGYDGGGIHRKNQRHRPLQQSDGQPRNVLRTLRGQIPPFTFALEELKDDLYKKFTKDTKFTTPTETLNSMIMMAVDFFFDKHNHIANIIRFNRNGKVISTIQDSIAHSIKYQLSKYKDTYEIKMPLQILSTFVAGGMINTVLWCVDNPGRYTYEEFISYATCPLAERCFVKK